MKFSEIKIGDSFSCFGDQHLNYDYPKICECIKIDDNCAREIEGINFSMNEDDIVFPVDIIANPIAELADQVLEPSIQEYKS